MAESKTLENFEFVTNPEDSAWQQFTEMLGKIEGCVAGKQDYWCWLNGLGSENVQFIVAYDKESLELVAGIVGLTHVSIDGSPHMSNIGYYYVLPSYRGIGLGLAICDELKKSKQIASGSQSVSSVPAMTKKYGDRYNFKKIQDWLTAQYCVETESADIDRLISDEAIPDVNIICPQEDPANVPWEQVFEYDRQFQGGVRRDNLLRCFLTLGGNSVAKIALDVKSQKVIGVGCVREIQLNRLLLGPLYADTPAIAQQLLYELLLPYTDCDSKITTKQLTDYNSLCFMIPSTNKSSVELINKLAGKEALAQQLLYELLLPYTNSDSKITTKQLTDYNSLCFMIPSTNKSAVDLINKLAGKEVPERGSSAVQFTDYVIDVPVNRLYSGLEFNGI